MKRFNGAVAFKFGGKVKFYGKRTVIEKLPQAWLVRVRLYCRDPETGRAYRIMRDLEVNKPTFLRRITAIVAMAARELREEAKGQQYSGGWFALAIKPPKKPR